MARAVINYDKDFPEIPGRLPWEKPTSFLVKDDAVSTGWREGHLRPPPDSPAPRAAKRTIPARRTSPGGSSITGSRKITKWSDYIDYWAVDWDFRSDTFMQGWVAYRTRKERKLPLACDPHTYEKAGKYRILVKVIDIFGNDTSQAFDVEVK